MQISVALDGTKRRDLEFFPGDDAEIFVTVYERDGDIAPIDVADMLFVYDQALSSQLTDYGFVTSFAQRDRYTLTGYVDGLRTTLAYGYLFRRWDDFQINPVLAAVAGNDITTEGGETITTEGGDTLIWE